MKARTTTLLSLALLASLLIGAITITVLSAPSKELKLKVKWTPRIYVYLGSVADPWNAEVYFAPPRPFDDINASTIRLEGTYEPVDDPYVSEHTSRLVIPFYGGDVVAALLDNGGHLTPGEYRIYLEITGELYDKTPFSGKGGLNLIVLENPPPI